jgi:hypothetical protein
MSGLSVLVAAQQKDLFDINRHLKGNKQFRESPKSTFILTPGSVYSNLMLLQYRLANNEGVYSHPTYHMPVIVPETTLNPIFNPALGQRLNLAIQTWPRESIAGAIPNPAPVISW